MNTLSIILYLADVSGGLVGALIAASLVTACLTALVVIRDSIDADNIVIKPTRFSILGILMLVTCLVPSSKTVYFIATSEMTEKVLNSEMGSAVQKRILEEITKGGEKNAK